MFGKKGALDIFENWAEYVSFILLVIGFFLAAGSGSAIVSYVIIALCGMVGGRILFKFKTDLKIPWVVIMLGFLIGFTIGSFYGDKRIIVIGYVIGIALSYYLHDKGILKTTEF
jgi:hypothetical protein